METKQKVLFFSGLAGVMASLSAVFAAQKLIAHIYIVLPLVAMGILLFISGYFAGVAKRK